jgi:Spy/CpxP family protein refolding chaperone
LRVQNLKQEVGDTNMNVKKTLTTAALAIVLAAVPLAAQRGHGMHRGMGPGFGPGGGFMLERAAVVLELTEAQKAAAQKLAEAAKKEAEPIVAQLKQNREELQAAVRSNNTGAISNLTTRQGNLMGQVAGIHAKTMAAFYAQLTPEQKAKADKLHEGMRDRVKNFRERGFRRGPARTQSQ